MVEPAASLPPTAPVAGQPAPASPPPVAAEAGALPTFAGVLLESLTRTTEPAAEALGTGPTGEERPADGSTLPGLAAALLAGLPGIPLPAAPAADASAPAPGSGAVDLAGPLAAAPMPPMAPARLPADAEADLRASLPDEAPEAPAGGTPLALAADAAVGALAARQRPAPPLARPQPETGPLDPPVDPAGAGVTVSVPAPGGGAQASGPASGVPATLALAPAVTDPRWAEALGGRVAWMVQGDVQHARLRLDPPDLGPLEVRISVVEEEARIAFSAPQAAVREAVEAALPRLREMLMASGVNLVQVDVSGQGGDQRPPPDPPGGLADPAAGTRSGQVHAPAPLDPGPRGLSLLDVYA